MTNDSPATVGRLRDIVVRNASRGPMQQRERAELAPGRGIVSDLRGTSHREVTLISRELWDDVQQELGVALPWHSRRANLLIEGIDFGHLIGHCLSIGPCRVEILGETDPCARMDEIHPGLWDALRPAVRAGVWGAVLEGGVVRVGDPVGCAMGSDVLDSEAQ